MYFLIDRGRSKRPQGALLNLDASNLFAFACVFACVEVFEFVLLLVCTSVHLCVYAPLF